MTIDDVKEALHLWATWAYQRGYGVGWASQTIEAKLMNEGQVIQSTGSHCPDNPKCEAMDFAICMLPEDLRTVIYHKFLFSSANQSIGDRLKISSHHVKLNLNVAYGYLLGKLDKHEAFIVGRVKRVG